MVAIRFGAIAGTGCGVWTSCAVGMGVGVGVTGAGSIRHARITAAITINTGIMFRDLDIYQL